MRLALTLAMLLVVTKPVVFSSTIYIRTVDGRVWAKQVDLPCAKSLMTQELPLFTEWFMCEEN